MTYVNAVIRCDVKLHYRLPAKTLMEKYQRNHSQNVLNRVANSYFQHPKHLESLKAYLAIELFLDETMEQLSDIKFCP